MYIGKQPTVGNFQVCDAITVVNGQAAYTMQVSSTDVNPENANHMLVSLNGVLQKPGSSFTISGATITFASNLATGDVIDFIILLGNVLDIGTPSDDSVTLAKMASGTDGNIISYDASGNPVAIATGNDGQVLTSAGAGAPPAFETLSAGKIGQVVQVVKTDTFSSAATSYTDLTGITVDITPSATSSKVLVLCSLTLAVSTGGGPQLKLLRDSTDLGLGDTASNRARITASYVISGTDQITSVPIIYLDSPSSTSALTYKVQGFGYNTNTIYVNRTPDDSDVAYRQRGSSSITVMEVLA